MFVFYYIYIYIYKKKVAIVYFLEFQYFSFHGEKSWIKHNSIFFSWFRIYLMSDKAYGG